MGPLSGQHNQRGGMWGLCLDSTIRGVGYGASVWTARSEGWDMGPLSVGDSRGLWLVRGVVSTAH